MSLEIQARRALANGDPSAASVAAKELVLQDVGKPTGYFLLGLAAEQIGEAGKAIALIQAAIEKGPEAEHLAQLARILSLMHRDADAAQAAHEAYDLSPTDALTLDTIGCVFTRLGDHEGAVSPFRSAVSQAPENTEFLYNLAAACGFTGRVKEARALYETILTAEPHNAKVHYALAILSRQTSKNNHVTRLETALSDTDDAGDKLRIRYALAKELEDIGDTAAFVQLKTANDEHKRNIAYEFAQDTAIFDAIAQLFDAGTSRLASTAGHSENAPVFVVGMPRTGTTLVDRILSSHSQVGSAGELQAMPLAVKRLAKTPSRQVIDPATIAASGSCDAGKLGELYMAHAAQHRPQSDGHPTRHFIDKLPANFLYIGHIAHALPNARIVCLRRSAMDTVWSNYKNLFASQSPYYSYSYDLMDTARYFLRFHTMMQMWDKLFAGRVLQLNYETLVADQETQTRRLLHHCGLDWDEACLHFHRNTDAVATPSAAQVRRPLNADGVGKWRRYEQQLEPVRQWFEENGIDTR